MVGCADEGDCVCYHQSTSSHYHRHQVLITAGVCAWIHHARAHGIATRTPMALPRTCAWHCHARAHGVFTALVYFRQTCNLDREKNETAAEHPGNIVAAVNVLRHSPGSKKVKTRTK